jgi:hypothetical protein
MKYFLGMESKNLDLPGGSFPIRYAQIYNNLPLEHPEVERAINSGTLVRCSSTGDISALEETQTTPLESKKKGLEDAETEDE